jgi:hypothetical protein
MKTSQKTNQKTNQTKSKTCFRPKTGEIKSETVLICLPIHEGNQIRKQIKLNQTNQETSHECGCSAAPPVRLAEHTTAVKCRQHRHANTTKTQK